MIDEIIKNVVNQMSGHLDREQLEHLRNTLYINFNGIEVRKETTALTSTVLFLYTHIFKIAR